MGYNGTDVSFPLVLDYLLLTSCQNSVIETIIPETIKVMVYVLQYI